MNAELAVQQILEDEGIRGDLDEAEANLLNQWLVQQVEKIASQAASDDEGWKQIKIRKQHARKVAKVVTAFRDQGETQAKAIAQQHSFSWPQNAPQSAQQLMAGLLQSLSN